VDMTTADTDNRSNTNWRAC